MRQFSITIDIAAPRGAGVWNVMSDVERWHEWTPSVTSVRLRGPLVVGTTAVIRQPKFPPAWWKVSAIHPGRSFTWISVGPGLRVIGRHSVEPIAAGTRATLSLELPGTLRRAVRPDDEKHHRTVSRVRVAGPEGAQRESLVSHGAADVH